MPTPTKPLTIKDLQTMARQRGGECLSPTYTKAKAKYRWRCAQGHQWEATAKSIRHGSWCPVCDRQARQLQLEDLQATARERGGECLSPAYTNCTAKYRWRCAQGHEWQAVATTVRKGTWCPICATGKLSLGITDLQASARAHGGECLSESYLGIKAKYRWRCGKGHEWEATATAVRQGSWCHVCNKGILLQIEDLQASARARGGECLSESYSGIKAKYRWRCGKGHEWETTAAAVRGGSWCHVCNRRTQRQIEDLQAIARERGGECLSSAYTNCSAKYRWRCAQGHEWEAMAGNVLYGGSWCPICAGQRGYTLNDLKNLAKRYDGQCLSQQYTGSKQCYRWQCAKGHEWNSRLYAIQYEGNWCPVCANRKPGRPKRFDDLQAMAHQRGGICLNEVCLGSSSLHTWRCAEGHEWEATPSQIQRGSWCPVCAGPVQCCL